MSLIAGDVLREAAEIVEGDRSVSYGEALECFTTGAAYLQVMFDREFGQGWGEIEPRHVAQIMILLKLARIPASPGKRDHWVDIAGYSGLGFATTENDDA